MPRDSLSPIILFLPLHRKALLQCFYTLVKSARALRRLLVALSLEKKLGIMATNAWLLVKSANVLSLSL